MRVVRKVIAWGRKGQKAILNREAIFFVLSKRKSGVKKKENCLSVCLSVCLKREEGTVAVILPEFVIHKFSRR